MVDSDAYAVVRIDPGPHGQWKSLWLRWLERNAVHSHYLVVLVSKEQAINLLVERFVTLIVIQVNLTKCMSVGDRQRTNGNQPNVALQVTAEKLTQKM